MTLFNRPYTIFYYSAIVTIVISYTIFKLGQFDVQNIVTLQSRLRSLIIIGNGTIRQIVYEFISYSSSIVTVWPYLLPFLKKGDIGCKKCQFLIPPCI